ncbi:MAG: SsrA-binding protein [Halobacteriovoraceae bacterium]|nr:SsrA-binding protein [Halobacteriovoraceae bacterium]|tara:strand:- start:153728 stop:154177 length:450 start_codon:yes stop_codon:yes gene_type:complete
MGIKVISKNKRASYDYFLEQKYEAGLSLKGTEVKSLRAGNCSMTEAFCSIDKNDEVWIHQMTIAHYEFGNIQNHEETRKRKLLLNRSEIESIKRSLATKGQTLVPTMVYFKGSKVKLEIALAKGKKLHDKRETKKTKEVERKLRQGIYE